MSGSSETPEEASMSSSSNASEPVGRLYGVPDAEELYDDPASAYETQIEPYHDGERHHQPIIEEWTVHPPSNHLPTVGHIVDWLVEWAGDYGELTEDAYDVLDRQVRGDVTVTAAAQALRDAVAAKMTYRMADKRVAVHTVTWDDQDEPLYDGEPMYRPAHSDAANVG